jgi:hypothetical protein
MAMITPAPRIGKTTGAAMPARPVRKPTKSRKPVMQAMQPVARGLINR